MAAYYKVEVTLNSQAVSVGLPSPQSVRVTLPLVGPQGPAGPQGEQGPPGEVSGSIAWDNVTDKPTTFPPSSHTHVAADITDFTSAVEAVSPPADWNTLANKPSTFPPSSHGHVAADVSDFATAAAAAAPVQSVAGKTGSVTLAKADVGLGNVDNTSDTNKPISSATQSALDGKAATSHTHTASQVTDFNTAAAAAAPVQSVNGNTGTVTVAVPSASTATPQALGTAAAGTSDDYSRADHIHAAPALNDLSNVSAATPSDNDVLVFDTATGTWVAEAPAGGGIAGSTGSTDNAILRADGTGGSTAQDSALVITDYSASTQGNVAIQANVAGFSVTGVASTSVFTAVGHNFIANQMVCFTSLTGGSGVLTTRAYFVRDISGDTFKLAFQSGGGALSISTDLTAGTIAPSVAVVIEQQGFGGILSAIPDGTATNGNFRGYGAIELCSSRTAATQVASGIFAAIVGGEGNTASNTRSSVCGGQTNVASGADAFCGGGRASTVSSADAANIGGNQNTASAGGAITLGGFQNQATATNALAYGRQGRADRYAIAAHGNINFATPGDSQRFRAVLSKKTTTDAAVEMALDNGTTYLTIPSGKVIFCNIKVVGVKSDGSAVATYERQYAAKNVAGTSTEIYAPVTIGTDNAAGTTLAISVVDQAGAATDYISIQPTGIASETWRWVASVDAVEVAYGT
jgi:hypothetical protein